MSGALGDADKLIDELLNDPENAINETTLEETIANLEAMAKADPRDAWAELKDEDGNPILDDEGQPVSRQLPPNKWPLGLAMAVENISPTNNGVSLRLVAKGRILEALARIKGAYSEAEEELTPVEQLLAEIPRDDLKELVKHLRFIADIKSL